MVNYIKISVITVTYNAESLIRDTILSVLEQKYPNLEFIAIDGKSEDRTMQIIGEYRDNISCIISEKDKGIYDAMNKGIDRATGDIAIFMNAGDKFISNEVLNSINRFVVNLHQDYTVIFGSTMIHYPFGTYVVKPDRPNKLLQCMPFCHQSIFVKTELLKKFKFNPQLKIAGDHEQLLKLYNDNPNGFVEYDDIIADYDAKNGISSTQILNTHSERKSFVIIPDSFFRRLRILMRGLLPQPILNPLCRVYFKYNERYKFVKE